MGRARLRKIFVVALWAAVVLLSGSVVAAWLLPQRLTYARQPYLAAATASFFIQAFQFHLGVIVVVLALVALALRRWRLAAVAVLGALSR